MDAVQRDLNLLLTPDQIDNGGLYIYTTLDPTVQKAATDALEKATDQSRAAIRVSSIRSRRNTALRPRARKLPCLIFRARWWRSITPAAASARWWAAAIMRRANSIARLRPANRQVGSAFKPFVYTLAFMHGLLPGAAVSDGPIQPGEIQGAGNWTPGNSDGRYGGIKPVSYGLIQSRNTMSVRVGEFAGLDDTQKVATTLGLGADIPRGAAIYIGSFETNLKDLTSAYTVFPNAGIRKQSYIIERIDDQDHQPIYRAAHVTLPVLDPGAAWMTTQLMQQVMTHGTAASARSLGFKLPAAGKTGTTNDYKDAWFVGYTSSHDLRRLGGLRSAGHHHPTRLRLGARPAGLDRNDAEGVRSLPGRGDAFTGGDSTGNGLFHLERDRDQRLCVGRDGLRRRPSGRQNPARRLQGARGQPDIVRPANGGIPTEGQRGAPGHHPILQTLLRRREISEPGLGRPLWFHPEPA